MYIAYINMLTGLSTGEQSSQHSFVLLQSNSHFYDYSHTPKISWNHIFSAFERYFDLYRLGGGATEHLQQQSGSATNFYQQQHQQQQQQQLLQQQARNRGITQQELLGLCSVTRLVAQIAAHNEKARMALCEYQRAVMSGVGVNNSAPNDSIALMNTFAANSTLTSGY